jgi:RNA polymerase sigma-70 factor, ECF subfamily
MFRRLRPGARRAQALGGLGARARDEKEVDTLRLSELYRRHAGPFLARLIRLYGGDFARAEAALSAAFRAAELSWPVSGEPAEPRAWLAQRAFAAHSGEATRVTTDDDYLRLFFTCCHPALRVEAQVALVLCTLCGLTTAETARVFAVEPAVIAQRVARAKNKLRTAKIAYSVPEAFELDQRLHAVLHAVHAIAAMSGEAVQLARLLTGLLPTRGEPWSLLALLLLEGPGGDRDEGLGCLDRALGLGDFSVYALSASIAALRVRGADWSQLEPLYKRLLARAENADEALEHVAAVVRAEGAERGLSLLEGLADDPSLSDYHLFYAARADLLRRVGRLDAAARDYTQALRLAGNEPERRYLARRLSELDT